MNKMLDEFTKIGLSLTEPYNNDINRISENIAINKNLQEQYDTKIKEHDDAYVKEEELSIEGFAEDLTLVKRNYSICLELIDSLNKDTKNLANSIYVNMNKKKAMNILFTNMCKSGLKLQTHWLYYAANIYSIFDDYKGLFNALKDLNPNDSTTYKASFDLIGRHLKNDLVKKLIPDLDTLTDDQSFFERLSNFNYFIDKHDYTDGKSWRTILAMSYHMSLNDSMETLAKISGNKLDFIYEAYDICEWINLAKIRFDKYSLHIIDETAIDHLQTLLYFYSSLTKALCKLVLEIVDDVQEILKYIEPMDAADTEKTDTLMYNIESLDPWISADYHLFKEYRKGETSTKRTEDIIAMHNKTVKRGDVLLFLGDISESEYYEKSAYSHLKEVKDVVKRLNGRKILIIGNNDTGTDALYKEMGFEEVYRTPIETQHYIFSHGPIETKTKLNIHGHIHGSKCYWNIDYKNHIDCYFGIWGRPVKLSELVKFYKTGMYNNCSTKIVDQEHPDPETVKKPVDITSNKEN